MNKKIVVFTTLNALSLFAMIGIVQSNSQLKLSYADYSCDHIGYHYSAVNPTATTSGHREFWACCECHEQFLAQPKHGTFVNATDEQMTGTIDSSHVAYLGPVSVWNGTNATAPGAGSGTEADPYLITSAAELAYYRIKVNQVDSTTHAHLNQLYKSHYKLTTNIDLAGLEWTQIGNSKFATFQGVFDGNGYSILNMKLTGRVCYGGLFGYIADAEIKNLSVTGTLTAGSGSFMDGMIAGVMHKSTIQNCQTFGTVVGTANSCAGIVGKVNKVIADTVVETRTESKILNCTNYANVSVAAPTAYPNGSVAGIVGETADTEKITIDNCINYGTVSGGTTCGGIIGKIFDTNYAIAITNCINVGDINGADLSGGIAGIIRQAPASYVTGCENYGNVSVTDSNKRAGGLVGLLRAPLSNCKVASNVKVCGTTVSSAVTAGVGGAYAWQIDSTHSGSVTGCSIVDPKY